MNGKKYTNSFTGSLNRCYYYYYFENKRQDFRKSTKDLTSYAATERLPDAIVAHKIRRQKILQTLTDGNHYKTRRDCQFIYPNLWFREFWRPKLKGIPNKAENSDSVQNNIGSDIRSVCSVWHQWESMFLDHVIARHKQPLLQKSSSNSACRIRFFFFSLY